MADAARPVALITGASRGLGRAFAVAFARRGHDVAVHYNTNADDAKATAELVAAAGGRALVLRADIRKSAEVNAMIETLTAEWGRLDVLVNNAGVVRNRMIWRMSDDEWRDVISASLDGTFYATRAALPLLRRAKGVVLSISSYVAGRGSAGAANYAAAKAGMIAFTKSLAQEEAVSGVRANAILPGFHVTDMNRGYWEKFESKVRDQHLLGKMPDRDEMADFVANIAALSTVTGQVFAFESRIL